MTTIEKTLASATGMDVKTRKPRMIHLGITLAAALAFTGCGMENSEDSSGQTEHVIAEKMDYNQPCANCHSVDHLDQKNPNYRHTDKNSPGFVHRPIYYSGGYPYYFPYGRSSSIPAESHRIISNPHFSGSSGYHSGGSPGAGKVSGVSRGGFGGTGAGHGSVGGGSHGSFGG